MKLLFLKLAAPVYIFRIIRQYEPAYLVWSALQIFVDSVLPLLYVYAPKLILGTLTGGGAFTDVLKIVLFYGGVLLILNLCGAFFTSKSQFSSDRFTKKLRYEIGKITMSLPLSEIERASVAESVNLAKNASAITETMSYIGKTASNLITIAGLAYLIARLDIICLISVLAVAALKSLFTYIQFSYMKKARILSAQNERTGDYLLGLAYFNHGAEKELRVGNLQSWFMGKIKDYRRRMVTLQYRDFRYSALFEAVLAVVTAFQAFIVLAVLAGNYINGVIGIADFTMMFAAVTSLVTALSAMGDQISLYNRQVINVSDYKKLNALRLDENDGVSSEASDAEIGTIEDIVFDCVCFTYPGSQRPALSDINIKIRGGEKLVVAGLNGAGKSTFIKLLCKFYKPTSGTITINGVDIWSIPNAKYYKLLASVFQDFASFAFTMGENVAFSDDINEKNISRILRELGMGNYADKSNTYITKNFSPNGVEPSGGEEQKLAVARAVYKDSPLLILDEPTASLDVKAESEIYENFFRLATDKTTIFISHRLAISKLADHIAVFSGGRIAEYGSHEELIEKGGLYAEMYEKQSAPYSNSL